jgi:hypothetical protein
VKNGEKNVQAAAYNSVRTVIYFHSNMNGIPFHDWDGNTNSFRSYEKKNEETGNNYKRVTNRKITKYSH